MKTPSAPTDLAALLARSRWFRSQPEGLKAALIAGGRVVQLARGQWLHSEGDAAAGLWSVLFGAVRLEASVGERDMLLNIVRPGRVAGQAVGSSGRRLVTVRAAEASRLFIISDTSLHTIAAAEPLLWRAISDLLYSQLEATVRMAAQALRLAPRARLAVRLLALTNPGEEPLPISQADLAELVGVSRKAVNGHLMALERQALVRLGYRTVTILDRAGLGALIKADG